MRRTSKALDFLVETIAHKARKEPPTLRDIDSELEKGAFKSIALSMVSFFILQFTVSAKLSGL
jgi:hypothetical protein